MPTLAQALKLNAAFASKHARLKPSALFVGGTSGIGQALAQRLAHHTQGNAHILLAGRNADAARVSIDSFPKVANHHHEFLPCDVSLMGNVRYVCSTLLARQHTDLPRLNFLVLSPGFFTVFSNCDPTDEGIDKKLAVLYYARWLFIHSLLPLLQNAAAAGEPAHVYSVLGAGTGSSIDWDDLGLKKRYGAVKAATVAATYTDLAMQRFAAHNRTVQFTHAFPGLVRTPMMLPKSWPLKPFGPLISMASMPFTVAPETCAEYHLSALFSPTDTTANFVRRGAKGDDIGYWPADEEHVEMLWEHTVRETGAI
ncbi:hypothetical protein MIND_00562100 [Mycena indigotica]|uniref:NAD(P)-binding protein n=1 Tax=Mycena indigotica TaxID=2126181 RepID=A0A8H6W2N0_9AGAR|nr:uncharacterized protein MIND_00562100 [Mycena indigotica]KAF7303344.1 hypothetical protein MIND_00562100 [Mycena indigotica]